MGTEQRKIKRQHTTKVRLLHNSLCFACGTQTKYTNKKTKYIIGETKDYEIKAFANHRKNTHTLPAIRIFSAANIKHQFTINLNNQLYLQTAELFLRS